MPRAKQYETDAERQAAYRARHADEQPPREALLAALARSLHGTIKEAARNGSAEAQAVAGAKADDTLRKLIKHFQTEEKIT